MFCCETAWKERPRGFERAAAELVNTYRGIRSRNHAAMRFARIFFRRESVFLVTDAAFGVGVTPEVSSRCRFLAMIAFECIRDRRLLACLAALYCEIILAAFLIMCNAAEIFFR